MTPTEELALYKKLRDTIHETHRYFLYNSLSTEREQDYLNQIENYENKIEQLEESLK